MPERVLSTLSSINIYVGSPGGTTLVYNNQKQITTALSCCQTGG